MPSETPDYYISITGLRLKSALHGPRFWYHAVRSLRQAQMAPGNILAEARTIDGVHHTRSVWDTRTSMITYLRSGAHLRAMAVFPQIATGKVTGLALPYIPDWAEVRAIWERDGRLI